MNKKLSKCLALTAVAGSFAFAGCGGSDSDDGPSAEDAQKAYAQVGEQLEDFGEELGAAVGSASGKTDVQIQSEFEALANKADNQVDDLKAIEVPEDVTSAKDDLVKSLQDGINDIQQIASAAAQHDVNAAGTATRQLLTDSKDIEEAQKELKAALNEAAK